MYIMRSTTPKIISGIPKNIPIIVIDVAMPPMIINIPKIKAKILEIISRERIVSASGGTLPKLTSSHTHKKILRNKVYSKITQRPV